MTAVPDDRVVRLADGTAAHIRPLRSIDDHEVRALYEHSSDKARYLRFFAPMSTERLVSLTRGPSDDDRHCMLAAEVDGRVVGLGQYDREDGTDSAELAFMVEDAFQGHGVATCRSKPSRSGPARGIRRFRASFLRTNDQMPDVFAHAGFDVREYHDLGVESAEFHLVAERPMDRRPRTPRSRSWAGPVDRPPLPTPSIPR